MALSRNATIGDVARALDVIVEAAALALLGEATGRARGQMRWGTHGSLSLEVAGPKRGEAGRLIADLRVLI